MNADDFRDYMLAFLFLRYLSDNYQPAAKKELGRDYPDPNAIGNGGRSSLSVWYERTQTTWRPSRSRCGSRRITSSGPEHLWASIAHMARTQNGELLNTLQEGFKYIENESFQSTFSGLVLGDQSRLRKAGQDLRRPERQTLHDHHRRSPRASRSSPPTATRWGTPTST